MIRLTGLAQRIFGSPQQIESGPPQPATAPVLFGDLTVFRTYMTAVGT